VGWEWESGSQLLINVDTEAGDFVRPIAAVPDFGASGENCFCIVTKDVLLLYTEIIAGEVEGKIGSMADRRNIPRPVPGSADIEKFTEGGEFPSRTDPTDLGDMYPNEIDEPIFDKRDILIRVVEQLTHRDRRARLLTHELEIVYVLRREWILKEEEVIRF